MSVGIFNGSLSASFQPSKAVLMANDSVTLDFTVVTSNGPTTVNWFMEFTDGDPFDAATSWNQETAEEDSAGGKVLMPKVVRTFADNGGTQLSDGTHHLSCQFIRRAKFFRIQQQVAAGAATSTVLSEYGDLAK